jgi:spore germination protein KB
MEKVRISPVQAYMLIISAITVTGHLLFIPVVLNHSGRDSWLAVLLTAITAIFIGYIVSSLAERYPGQTLVQYSQKILGKLLGKWIAVLFLLYFFHDVSLAVRGFGEFFTSAITPRTPIIVYFIAIVTLAVYAVRHGLEVMARTNQFFLAMMIPVGILATILTQKDKDYGNVLPLLEYGLQPSLMGMFSLSSLFSTFIVISMVFPYVKKNAALKRSSIITMLLLILMFMGPATAPVLIFGAERAVGLTFPTFQILRDIEIGGLQRLDIIAIILWSLGSFAKVTLFLYAVVLGLAQLFRMEDYRSLTVPVGALIVIYALLLSESLIEIYRFFRDIYPYYSTLIGFGVPLILLLISRFRAMLHPK